MNLGAAFANIKKLNKNFNKKPNTYKPFKYSESGKPKLDGNMLVTDQLIIRMYGGEYNISGA